MTNVVQLNVPARNLGLRPRRSAIIAGFAQHRRFGDDVFWLKENAELLNILECTATEIEDHALAPHEPFYDSLENRMGFFPQYYRFLLSICLDLEDLGMPGNKGEALAEWVSRQGLPEAEMSDLQRAEARRLLARRGVRTRAADPGLDRRLHAFIDRSETFAMPNKKAAYELTHIVFYLSEYGRRAPCLSERALTSLEFAGILAYLDQNADLLAEICVALRYAGTEPPRLWEDWLERETRAFLVDCGPQAALSDDYHEYFVCNWLMALAGRAHFDARVEPARMAFNRARSWAGPLRQMSQSLFEMQDRRNADWTQMRARLTGALSETGHEILCEAEACSDKFDAFFAGFARAGLGGTAL